MRRRAGATGRGCRCPCASGSRGSGSRTRPRDRTARSGGPSVVRTRPNATGLRRGRRARRDRGLGRDGRTTRPRSVPPRPRGRRTGSARRRSCPCGPSRPTRPRPRPVAWSGSQSKGNPSRTSRSNASCLSGRSGEIPTTSAPMAGEVLPVISEVAGLHGASGRVRLRIEVDEELLPSVVLQTHGSAALVQELEGRRRVAGLQRARHAPTVPAGPPVAAGGPERSPRPILDLPRVIEDVPGDATDEVPGQPPLATPRSRRRGAVARGCPRGRRGRSHGCVLPGPASGPPRPCRRASGGSCPPRPERGQRSSVGPDHRREGPSRASPRGRHRPPCRTITSAPPGST